MIFWKDLPEVDYAKALLFCPAPLTDRGVTLTEIREFLETPFPHRDGGQNWPNRCPTCWGRDISRGVLGRPRVPA